MEKIQSDESALAGAKGLIKEDPKAPVVAAPAASAAQAPATAPVTAPATSTAAPVNPAIVINTPLGTQTYGGAPIESVKLTSFDDVQKFAKEYAGVELKEVQDFVPLLANLKQSKEQAAKAAELQKQVETFTSTVENLPKEVSLILNAAISGGDYMAVITNLNKKAALAFDKPFESQDQLKLVEYYTGKPLTKESFDALDETTRDFLTTSVKLKYDTDRESVLNFETNTKKATEERQTKFLASVEASINAMLASNPNMDKTAVAEVKKTMLYGLSEELFAKDKTYVPEAAEKIAMLKYGKQTIAAQTQTIGDIVKRITNESVSKATEKILLKSDAPIMTSGAAVGDNNLIAAEVARATNWLPNKR
jgi:hypothetical protein